MYYNKALLYILVLLQEALKLRLLLSLFLLFLHIFSFTQYLSNLSSFHNPDPLNGIILFSGLSRFSAHFGGDKPSPLNRDTTVVCYDFR